MLHQHQLCCVDGAELLANQDTEFDKKCSYHHQRKQKNCSVHINAVMTSAFDYTIIMKSENENLIAKSC